MLAPSLGAGSGRAGRRIGLVQGGLAESSGPAAPFGLCHSTSYLSCQYLFPTRSTLISHQRALHRVGHWEMSKEPEEGKGHPWREKGHRQRCDGWLGQGIWVWRQDAPRSRQNDLPPHWPAMICPQAAAGSALWAAILHPSPLSARLCCPADISCCHHALQALPVLSPPLATPHAVLSSPKVTLILQR